MKKLLLFSVLSLSTFSFGQTYQLLETDFGSFSSPGNRTISMTLSSVSIESPSLSCEVLDATYSNVAYLPYSVSPTQDTVLFIHNITNDTYLNLTIDILGASVFEATLFAFTVSPNPSINTLYVNIENYYGSFDVYDMTGKLLIQTMEKSIDVRSLSSGSYFLRAGERVQKVLIK